MGVQRFHRIILLLVLSLCFVFGSTSRVHVSYDARGIKLNGHRKLILSGSIHYPRSTPEMWPDLIKKAKEGGLNTIETYVFWNAHEPTRGQYDFSGNLDLVRFIKTVHKEGLYAILRIGPYVCAEWTYGGFPVWLHNLPGIKLRTNNEVYKNEMKTFTTMIVNLMKRNKLFAPQGGPIILSQIENEYGNVIGKYGDEGKEYVKWCADLATSYKIGIPWIMCQQDDAPESMISSCNGFYCDDWKPRNPNAPKVWTENWSGWFKDYGMGDPHRSAEDLAFAVARFFQKGGSVHNYYMYHGGTNFGRTAGGPFITTSYDYNAPLDEYGNKNQPKWGHLKSLHKVLKSIEKPLLYGEKSETGFGQWANATVYSYKGKSVCFLANVYQEDKDITVQGTTYRVPGWSVSILPDCETEVYNTAKVNAQTSVMVKKTNGEDDDNYEGNPFGGLNWVWRDDKPVGLSKSGHVRGSLMMSHSLLDQKIANDTSDYLWYITRVNIKKRDSLMGKKKINLHVHTNGHVVHAFFNKKYLGYKYSVSSNDFVMDKRIKIKRGKNEIALLSTTVGYNNYGEFFDETRHGIWGPVKLVGENHGEKIIKNVSSSLWIYKSGLYGEENKFYEAGIHNARRAWHSTSLPSNRPFVWYKATFPTPLGTDPVVVDLRGLSKGEVWVNGKSIGRFWASLEAKGCNDNCDYRGAYSGEKCVTGCGEPTQRWYHIPRSFLKEYEDNVMVVFDEFGGSPQLVKIQTVTIGKVCATAYEDKTLELSCQGGSVFKEFHFADYGEPEGDCGDFSRGSCGARHTMNIINQKCLGKERCVIRVSDETFGASHCNGEKRLAVEASCGV
ncbi:PREDICTED: beta-galactosidase 15-like [Tarenaya hassleriana]|uniref:beta-galactosidase 15-like n=1 Tax=Tarenaya hassleriana TaxID=28532 RepID=UPI00053C0F61|nr:PREDICTED: beta-galactosidase 15-like [Tarenaya hassleriana]